mgnify:CR=1 FL=1
MRYETPKLKAVSKAKHWILEKYFPAWARILGSKNPALVYVDCFAGAGKYAEGEEGSPLLILRKAQELVCKPNFHSNIILIFVEKNQQAADALRSRIPQRESSRVCPVVIPEDAHNFIPQLLEAVPRDMPAFFFIDPYGHPLTIPVMNQILLRPKTEILLTLMWYAINMHLDNPKVGPTIDEMFGHAEWMNQKFMKQRRIEREISFVSYFLGQLKAEYKLKFKIRFSPEDKVQGGARRTKYYLVHLANHFKAVLLMKEVMWPLGDELGTFDYSATAQQPLFSQTPTVADLKKRLKDKFAGSRLTFEELQKRTWDWPFIEKHYRQAVKELEADGLVQIERKSSKYTGVKDKDLITFEGAR